MRVSLLGTKFQVKELGKALGRIKIWIYVDS